LRYPEPPDKPYSLDDVAETLHISRQRASELEHSALNRILKPSALDMELT
jgi:DNA-directed RNA polymerase sigma subunit (sigma70/sigma32)